MNNNSFSDIYSLHYKRSFLLVKSYVHDNMAAEDIVSESLISLWQTMKKEKVEFPHTLLLVILKNNALNYLKHQSVKQTAIDSISSSMIRDLNYRMMSLEACDPEEVFSSEITEIINKALQSLPTQTRLVFELSRYENCPVKEIAKKISITPKAVEYHITKSLKVLRIALKEYLYIFFYFYL